MLITSKLVTSFDWTRRTLKPIKPSVARKRVASGAFFLFNFITFVFVLYISYSPIYLLPRIKGGRLKKLVCSESSQTCLSLRVVRTPFSRFFKTVQRAPMAHRQWSQVQYKRSFVQFSVRTRVPTVVSLLDPLNCCGPLTNLPQLPPTSTSSTTLRELSVQRRFLIRVLV